MSEFNALMPVLVLLTFRCCGLLNDVLLYISWNVCIRHRARRRNVWVFVREMKILSFDSITPPGSFIIHLYLTSQKTVTSSEFSTVILVAGSTQPNERLYVRFWHRCCGQKSWPNLCATPASRDTAVAACKTAVGVSPRRTTSVCLTVLWQQKTRIMGLQKRKNNSMTCWQLPSPCASATETDRQTDRQNCRNICRTLHYRVLFACMSLYVCLPVYVWMCLCLFVLYFIILSVCLSALITCIIVLHVLHNEATGFDGYGSSGSLPHCLY